MSHVIDRNFCLDHTGDPIKKDNKTHFGLARGGTVRAKHIGTDFLAGIKSSTVGGEIKGYTKLLADAREEAIVRMKKDAQNLGANSIVGMNFSTSVLDSGMAEMCAFGTAVWTEAV